MSIFLLILSVAIGGVIPFFWKTSEVNFKHALTFSASYLLCVTLFHLFPELFEEAEEQSVSTLLIGGLLIAGFLFQKVLEFFSGGVEHGHIHQHHKITPHILLIALCIHALLEGTVLTSTSSHHHHSSHLLFGIVLHKIPAAFALTSILLHEKITIKKTVIYLAIFSMASPLGLILSKLLVAQMSEKYTIYLFAIVTGNLLHITTTIFFESSIEHRLSKTRWLVVLLGIVLALGVEFL